LRRVLAVRLDNLGDLLMTTPALSAMRASLPQAHITLLASTAGAAAAVHVPVVDEAMRSLLADRALARQLGQRARAGALERFHIDRFIADGDQAFRTVPG
jgi:ADP-heptose:LPS heptosyltransferase